MKCHACGGEIDNNAKFCMYCGSSSYVNLQNNQQNVANNNPQNLNNNNSSGYQQNQNYSNNNNQQNQNYSNNNNQQNQNYSNNNNNQQNQNYSNNNNQQRPNYSNQGQNNNQHPRYHPKNDVYGDNKDKFSLLSLILSLLSPILAIIVMVASDSYVSIFFVFLAVVAFGFSLAAVILAQKNFKKNLASLIFGYGGICLSLAAFIVAIVASGSYYY